MLLSKPLTLAVATLSSLASAAPANSGVMAVISWQNYAGVRAYTVDFQGFLCEWGIDKPGNWWGPNRLGPRVATGSHLFATNNNDVNIRVYYTDVNDNRSKYIYWNNGWQQGDILP